MKSRISAYVTGSMKKMSRIPLLVVITLTWAQPGFTADPGSGVLPPIFNILLDPVDPDPTSWLTNWICLPVSGTKIYTGTNVGIYFTPRDGAFPPTSGEYTAGELCGETSGETPIIIYYIGVIEPYGGATLIPAISKCTAGDTFEIKVVASDGTAKCSYPIIEDPP